MAAIYIGELIRTSAAAGEDTVLHYDIVATVSVVHFLALLDHLSFDTITRTMNAPVVQNAGR